MTTKFAMHNRGTYMLATSIATLIFAVGVGNASANNLSTNATRWRVVWSPLTMSFTSGSTVRCNVTMDRSFHSSTMRKIVGALIGGVTGATFSSCLSNTVLTATLPWHIRYRGFTGTLPNITGVRQEIVGMGIRFVVGGSVPCLLTSTVENPWVETVYVSGTRVIGIGADPTAVLPLEGFFCPWGGEATFSGTGTVSRAGTTVHDVTIRLI